MASYDNFFGVPAVEVLQPSSEAWRNRGPFPVLLTCEHASADLPPGYAWGEDEWLADMHWAVDLGVKELLDELQRRIDCPAIASCFSRLFVDINRVRRGPAAGRAASLTPLLCWRCWRPQCSPCCSWLCSRSRNFPGVPQRSLPPPSWPSPRSGRSC
jgi:hypothetical protein